MHTYLIVPHASLVLRTGKPFGETGGGESHPFPLPSTVAGALRTSCADEAELDFDHHRERILAWPVGGPLPALIRNGSGIAPLMPRPNDALFTLAEDGKMALHRLRPLPLAPDEGCDLPSNLLPVTLEPPIRTKPGAGAVWWTLGSVARWLMGRSVDPENAGHPAVPFDVRTHVRLDPKRLAAMEGQLFQSSGPDFDAPRDDTAGGWQPYRFGMLVRFGESVPDTLVRLGGEGRLSTLTRIETGWPAVPEELATSLDAARRIRLVLATPAIFDKGWRPGWLDRDLTGECPAVPGLVLKLKAAAIAGWQPISGWDVQQRKPKAIRRMVPAGSVYWFDIVRTADDWPNRLWLHSICDNPQDRRDGFGLTVAGIWD